MGDRLLVGLHHKWPDAVNEFLLSLLGGWVGRGLDKQAGLETVGANDQSPDELRVVADNVLDRDRVQLLPIREDYNVVGTAVVDPVVRLCGMGLI